MVLYIINHSIITTKQYCMYCINIENPKFSKVHYNKKPPLGSFVAVQHHPGSPESSDMAFIFSSMGDGMLEKPQIAPQNARNSVKDTQTAPKQIGKCVLCFAKM